MNALLMRQSMPQYPTPHDSGVDPRVIAEMQARGMNPLAYGITAEQIASLLQRGKDPVAFAAGERTSPAASQALQDPGIEYALTGGMGANAARGLGAMARGGIAALAAEVPLGAVTSAADRFAPGAAPWINLAAGTLIGGAVDPLLERMTGRAVPQFRNSLTNQRGVIQVGREPSQNALLNVWGDMDPTSATFKRVDRLPELTRNVTRSPGARAVQGGTKLYEGAEAIAAKFGDNPFHRELASAYQRGAVKLDQAEQIFKGTINRGPDGRSAFDQMFDLEIKQRGEHFNDPKWHPYAEARQPVSSDRKSNMKTEGELIPLDTSRGCIGMCPSCYAATGGSKQGKICFADPQPVELTGHFSDDPEMIRRIGEAGEPNMNPLKWKQYSEQFKAEISAGQMTPQRLDEYISRTYDWSYTNEQIKKVGLDSHGTWDGNKYVPGGRDQTFIITKLQSLEGFDPTVIKNLEVSVDPAMPDHFFKALKNVETLKQQSPGTNIMLRVRSVSSASDEINTLQKIAVDFANQHDMPILETRVRFKNPEAMAAQQVLPEYTTAGGNQYKHVSYYPSQHAEAKKTQEIGENSVRTFDIHTETGPVPSSVFMSRKTDSLGPAMSKHKQAKAQVWEVWSGGKRVQGGLTEENAKALSNRMVIKEHPDLVPSKTKVREYALEESPLSQFGLHPNLHKQCNTFNSSVGACSECQGCRAWLDEAKLRAITTGRSPGLSN